MFSALPLMVALVSQASAGEWSDDKKLVLGDLCLSEHAPKVSDNGELQVRFCACFIEEVSAAAPPESLSTPEAPAMLNEADRACRAQLLTPSAADAQAPMESFTEEDKTLIRDTCLSTQAARPDVESFCACKTELLITRATPSQLVSALGPELAAEADAVCADGAPMGPLLSGEPVLAVLPLDARVEDDEPADPPLPVPDDKTPRERKPKHTALYGSFTSDLPSAGLRQNSLGFGVGRVGGWFGPTLMLSHEQWVDFEAWRFEAQLRVKTFGAPFGDHFRLDAKGVIGLGVGAGYTGASLGAALELTRMPPEKLGLGAFVQVTEPFGYGEPDTKRALRMGGTSLVAGVMVGF
jgi:hypothetical protein